MLHAIYTIVFKVVAQNLVKQLYVVKLYCLFVGVYIAKLTVLQFLPPEMTSVI